MCQKCDQPGHWSFECKANTTTYSSRPSRTQLLRRGLKLTPQEVIVEGTSDRDQFEADLKIRAALLEEELRREAGLSSEASDIPTTTKFEIGVPGSDTTPSEIKTEIKSESIFPDEVNKRHRTEYIPIPTSNSDEQQHQQGTLDRL